MSNSEISLRQAEYQAFLDEIVNWHNIVDELSNATQNLQYLKKRSTPLFADVWAESSIKAGEFQTTIDRLGKEKEDARWRVRLAATHLPYVLCGVQVIHKTKSITITEFENPLYGVEGASEADREDELTLLYTVK